MMTVASMFSVAGILIAALYFVLFYLALAKLGRAETDRFIAAFAGRKTHLVAAALLAGVLFVPSAVIAMTLAVLGLAWGARETLQQHRRIRELAFDAAFERRLFRIGFLVPLFIACLLAAKFWPHGYGAS